MTALEGVSPYPVFAYIKECVGNAPATGCKGCECVGGCATNPQCACRNRSHDGLSPYTPDGDIKTFTGPDPIECGPSCACNAKCGLRVSQPSVAVSVEVRWTGKRRGWGVFTREALRKGQYAMSYLGEILNEAQANARFQEISDRGGNPNYQTEVQVTSSSTGIVIDANYGGNVSRLINHSCDPNLALKKVSCGMLYPRVSFFATREIPAGAELTFNYIPHKKKKKKTMAAAGGPPRDPEEMQCYCGAASCRDVIKVERRVDWSESVYVCVRESGTRKSLYVGLVRSMSSMGTPKWLCRGNELRDGRLFSFIQDRKGK